MHIVAVGWAWSGPITCSPKNCIQLLYHYTIYLCSDVLVL